MFLVAVILSCRRHALVAVQIVRAQVFAVDSSCDVLIRDHRDATLCDSGISDEIMQALLECLLRADQVGH